MECSRMQYLEVPVKTEEREREYIKVANLSHSASLPFPFPQSTEVITD